MLSGRRAAATLAALPLLALAAPAAAELPPQVYERARAEAASVILVRIAGVDRPRAPFASGSCTLRGRVTAVERGAAYRPGQQVAIALPCIGARYRAMPGPFPGYDAARLGDARRGRLFLDGAGALVRRGYDPLPR